MNLQDELREIDQRHNDQLSQRLKDNTNLFNLGLTTKNKENEHN